MRLLYLVFGSNVKNHLQCRFSILTFLRQQADLSGITVLTDAPNFYQHLADYLTVVPMPEHTLREWQGEYNFFWRVKIKALQYLAQQYPGQALLYLDSDTFLHGSLPLLAQALARGGAFMHEPEGPLATLRSKTEQQMWQQTNNQTFGGVRVHSSHQMWNAGAVGIPGQSALQTINLALQICDDLCQAQVTPRLIEQFALSLALAEQHPLFAARPYIGHYWSAKEAWNEHITGFLLESYLQRRTMSQELIALNDFDFQAAPVKKMERNTMFRLKRLVERLFPAREVTYAASK